MFQCGEQKVQKLWVREHAGTLTEVDRNWRAEGLVRDEARKVGRGKSTHGEPGKNFSLCSKSNGRPLKGFGRGRH